MADHLSRLNVSGTGDISDSFPDEHLLVASSHYWDLRLEKLSKSLSKIMIATEGVESKHSTS